MDLLSSVWIDRFPDPVCITDPNEVILYANVEAVRISGASDAGELLGKPVTTVFGTFESDENGRIPGKSFEAYGRDPFGRNRCFLVSLSDVPGASPASLPSLGPAPGRSG